jgi:hypothetical protein
VLPVTALVFTLLANEKHDYSRLSRDTAAWLERTSAKTGVPQGRLVPGEIPEGEGGRKEPDVDAPAVSVKVAPQFVPAKGQFRGEKGIVDTHSSLPSATEITFTMRDGEPCQAVDRTL